MKRNSKAIREKKSREYSGDSFDRKRRKHQKQMNKPRLSVKFGSKDYIDYDELNTNEDF